MPTPTRRQLISDIIANTYEIMRIKEQITLTNDSKEKRRLKIQLKELHYLQLWQYKMLLNNN